MVSCFSIISIPSPPIPTPIASPRLNLMLRLAPRLSISITIPATELSLSIVISMWKISCMSFCIFIVLILIAMKLLPSSPLDIVIPGIDLLSIFGCTLPVRNLTRSAIVMSLATFVAVPSRATSDVLPDVAPVMSILNCPRNSTRSTCILDISPKYPNPLKSRYRSPLLRSMSRTVELALSLSTIVILASILLILKLLRSDILNLMSIPKLPLRCFRARSIIAPLSPSRSAPILVTISPIIVNILVSISFVAASIVSTLAPMIEPILILVPLVPSNSLKVFARLSEIFSVASILTSSESSP